jgi:hypothetical protein
MPQFNILLVLFLGPLLGCGFALVFRWAKRGQIVAAALVGQALFTAAFRVYENARWRHLLESPPPSSGRDRILAMRAVPSSFLDYAFPAVVLLLAALVVAGATLLLSRSWRGASP